MGDSLRRYVLAEAEAFRVSVIEPVAAHGTGEGIGAAAVAATQRLNGPTLDTWPPSSGLSRRAPGPRACSGGSSAVSYGQTVNLASRIADYARPGEVLVSQAVVDRSADVAVTFVDVGPAELKGVASSVHLHAARRP
jgi:hypothetical protein